MASTRKPVPENTIPEVAAFIEAELKIERLKAAYPEVFEQFQQLAEEYNTQLESAEKAVRGRGVSCGPFTVMSSTNKYDPDKLFEELGREKFLELGGTVKTITVYDVDKARLEAHIAAGAVPDAVLGETRTIVHRYKKPEKIVF
jgi:hypothetical protein